MTANTPVKSATSGDLANFRTDKQGVKFGLSIHSPATVYTAQINQVFDSLDGVVRIEYDNGSGTLADVLAGMTMLVGSSAGAYDKGIVRLRKAPTDAYFNIGATSDIQFAPGDHLTVIDDFGLWGRDVETSGGTILMDSEITYAARGAECLIRAAPMVAVIELVEGVATFTPPSPALSACYDGATISSWEYTAADATSTSNMTAGDGTASWEYEDEGWHRWALEITDSNGRTAITHRWVYVKDTEADFAITENPKASLSDGGWSFGVTMYDDTSAVKDRALVVLYAEAEYFGGVAATIGKLSGYENVIAVGWIDGETITRDPDTGQVAFMVHGAAHWFDKLYISPMALSDTQTTPTTWDAIEDMTADKAAARTLIWLSTASLIMDCFLSGDTTPIDLLTQPSDTLLAQLQSIASNTIFANPLVNSLCQLFVQINPQMMDSTARAALTTVMDITTAEYDAPLEIEKRNSTDVSILELQCNSYDGVNILPVYSRAPGNKPLRFGSPDSPSNYYAVDQAECNRLAGCLLAAANPKYEPLYITLAHQNRLIDIAPAQLCEITINDTLRGIALTDQKLILSSVELQIDGNYYKTVCEFDLLTAPVDGITYYPPEALDETEPDYDTGLGGIGMFPSIDTSFPPAMPSLTWGTPSNCKTQTSATAAPRNQFPLAWDKSIILSSDSDRVAHAYFPCAIRMGTADNPTAVFVGGTFTNCAGALHLYGVSGGSRVITATGGVNNARGEGATFTFSPVSAVDVDGFELEMDAGEGYSAGEIVATGSVNANNSSGVSVTGLSIGQLYAVEGSGGPFNVAGLGSISYNFDVKVSAAFSGNLGRYRVPSAGVNEMYLTIPVGWLFAEQVGDNYGRAYFEAIATSFYFRCWDSNNPAFYPDNTGSLGYILRLADGAPRNARFGSSVLQNVCAI